MCLRGLSIVEQREVANLLRGYVNMFERIYEGNDRAPDRHPEIKNPEGKYLRIYTPRGLEILELAKKVEGLE